MAVQAPAPHPSILELKRQGDQAYGGRNYKAAVANYSEALEQREDVTVLSNRSAAYAQLRRFPEALKDADRGLGLQPHWPRLLHRRGHALFHLGRLNEAVRCFEDGLKLDPQDRHLHTALERAGEYTEPDPDAPPEPPRPRTAAQLLVGNWMYGTAGKSYDVRRVGGVLQYDGPHQRVGRVLGTLHWNSETQLEAELSSEEGEVVGSIRLNISEPGKTIISNYRAQANPDWGKDIIAHKGRPVSSEELREQGNKFFREGKYSLAVRAYGDAVSADSSDPKSFGNRAAAQMELLKSYGARLGPDQIKANPYYGSALTDLEEAVMLDRKYVKAWVRKGQLLCMGGEVQKALLAYENGLSADPESKDCLAGKASCEKWLAQNQNGYA